MGINSTPSHDRGHEWPERGQVSSLKFGRVAEKAGYMGICSYKPAIDANAWTEFLIVGIDRAVT